MAPRLPSGVANRLKSLVSKQIAQDVWSWGEKFKMEPYLKRELQMISQSLKREQWEIYIPQLIPRSPHFQSDGDASLTAGGALSDELYYWFVVFWSDKVLWYQTEASGSRIHPH